MACLPKHVFMLCFFLLTSCTLIFAQEEEMEDLSLADLFNLEVVTATKNAQSVSEAPAIITAITAEQIKDRGYKSVAEALSSIAGIDVIHDYFQPNIGIRGITGGLRSYSRIIKLMIDGQPVSNRASSNNFLSESLIPMEVISRIEVIRGPNSALYGADAYLGVVNIITKGSDKIEYVHAHGGGAYGEDNLSYDVSSAVGKHFENWGIVLAGRNAKIDNSGKSPVDLFDSTGKAITNFNNQKTGDDLSRPISAYGKVTGKGQWGSVLIDGNLQYIDGDAWYQDWHAKDSLGYNRINFFLGTLRGKYEKAINDNISFNIASAYATGEQHKNEYFDFNRDTTDGYLKRNFGYHSLDLKAEGTFAYKFGTVNIGSDFTLDKHRLQLFTTHINGEKTVNVGAPTSETTKNLQNTGAYLQGILKFGLFNEDNSFLKNAALTGGIRYDYHNVYGSVITGRGAFVFKIIEKGEIFNDMHVKILYGNSFKAPSPTQLYTNTMKGLGDVVGDTDVGPEKAHIVEALFSTQFAKYFMLNVNGFYNRTIDKVILKRQTKIIGTANNIGPVNESEINSWGIESEFIMNLNAIPNIPINTYLNYSFQKSNVQYTYKKLVGVSSEDATVFAQTILYPSSMVKFGTNVKIPKIFLNINLEGKYIGKRFSSEENEKKKLGQFLEWTPDLLDARTPLDGFFLMNLNLSSLGIKWINDKETTFSVKISNILNTDYTLPGSKEFDIPGKKIDLNFSVTQHF